MTGAATGVGREIALQLSLKGAQPVLWDINQEELEKTAEMVKANGMDAEMRNVNLADPSAINEAAQLTDPVWCVINNAGIIDPTSVMDSSMERNELVFRINALAHIQMAKCFLGDMITKNDGAFVTVSSIASYLGAPKMATYAASKAAARLLIECLAQEVQPIAPGVHFGCLCPSHINTSLFAGFGKSRGIPVLEPKDVAHHVVDELIERSVPHATLPKRANFTIAFRGLISESIWRRLAWPGLKNLMKSHNADHAKQIWSEVQTSKL